MDGIELDFSDDCLDFVVEKTMEQKLGARGLRSIVETIMIDAMFAVKADDAGTKLVIDRAYAESKYQANAK